jgi:hypothetical protein
MRLEGVQTLTAGGHRPFARMELRLARTTYNAVKASTTSVCPVRYWALAPAR